MILVGLLTEQQKNKLVGQFYSPDSYFNPIQDNEDNWVISQEEMEQNINEQFGFVKTLPLIEYNPKQTEMLG